MARRWQEGRKSGIWRRTALAHVAMHGASIAAFIQRFDRGGRGPAALPWKPSKEADVDIPNSFEPSLLPPPMDAADPPDPPCGARWRQRPAGPESREHVDLPLDVPDEPPLRPSRDAELWLLARRARGAALQVPLELRTALVRQAFRRDFVYVSRLLHALEASRRVQGLDHGRLDDALAALHRRADEAQALMQGLHADLEARVAARAPSGAQVTFARPARLLATVVSPTAHRYLALLKQADATLAQLERAWLLGVVDPATRTAFTADCRRALHGYKDLASDRRADVGDHVREINARRRRSAASGDA